MPPQTYNDFFSPVSTETAHSGIDELIAAGELRDPGSISAADPWWNKYIQAKESLGDWALEMFPPTMDREGFIEKYGEEEGLEKFEGAEVNIQNLFHMLPEEKWELPLYAMGGAGSLKKVKKLLSGKEKSLRDYMKGRQVFIPSDAPLDMSLIYGKAGKRMELIEKGNKPYGSFWTSSWKDKELTTDWGQFIGAGRPGNDKTLWKRPRDLGAVFKAGKKSKIYMIENEKDFEKLLKEFPGRKSDFELWGRHSIDWGKMASQYDAIHVKNPNVHEGLQGWDVESTAWFNTDKLKFLGTTKIKPKVSETEKWLKQRYNKRKKEIEKLKEDFPRNWPDE